MNTLKLMRAMSFLLTYNRHDYYWIESLACFSNAYSNTKDVVWVKYSEGGENSIKKISTQEALKKILPDAWISNKEVNAKAFLKWIKHTKFYELHYSDNKKLITTINTFY
jgi:hypothetical protein